MGVEPNWQSEQDVGDATGTPHARWRAGRRTARGALVGRSEGEEWFSTRHWMKRSRVARMARRLK